MNKLCEPIEGINEGISERLIEQLCPNGVVWKTLGELGEFFSGLTGKSKDDFTDGNAKFITYMNVYSNLALKTDVPDRVKVSAGEKQNTLEKGDVLFTGSSETPDECGMSSVVTVDVTEPLYLNSFCFGFRLADKKLFNPDFLKHLLRSTHIRKQITRTASGVTRFNVSKAKMAKVSIPVPPIEVQGEIVQILDNFANLKAELEAELEAELAARIKQYQQYRDTLLSGDWPRVKLGDVCKICDNRRKPISKKDRVAGAYPYYGANGIQDYVEGFLFDGDYLLVGEDGSVINADKSPVLTWATGKFWVNNHAHVLLGSDRARLRFLYYILKTKDISAVVRGTPPKLNQENLRNIEIPLPPLAEQERIVGILDKFDKLVNSLTEGLPAEISARQKQYEYYRDKLLSFGKEAK